MDPLTIVASSLTLGSRAIQFFAGCQKVYKGFKLTQSFGNDYHEMYNSFYLLSARVEAVANRNYTYLKTQMRFLDEDDPVGKSVVMALENLHIHFLTCERLNKKYEDRCKPQMLGIEETGADSTMTRSRIFAQSRTREQ